MLSCPVGHRYLESGIVQYNRHGAASPQRIAFQGVRRKMLVATKLPVHLSSELIEVDPRLLQRAPTPRDLMGRTGPFERRENEGCSR